MKMRKLITASAAFLIAVSPVAALTVNNENVQTVQAAPHKRHKKSKAKIHKCSLWAFDTSARKIYHITAWKKAHTVITGGAGTFTFERLYYFPKDHKWEIAGPYKTKAKARAAMKRRIKEDEESERENKKMEQEENDED